MDIIYDQSLAEKAAQNALAPEPEDDCVLENYDNDPRVKKLLQIKEMVRDCVAEGLPPDAVLEYLCGDIEKTDFRQVAPPSAPPISPSKDEEKSCLTGAISHETVSRLVEKIIQQPKSKQHLDFRILRELLEPTNPSYRGLARLTNVSHQTVANRIKIYRDILEGSPEKEDPLIDDGLVQFVVLWFAAMNNDLLVNSFEAKNLTGKMMLSFADRLYPHCNCRVRRRTARPKNLKRHLLKLKKFHRSMHLCAKCAPKLQGFHAFRATYSADRHVVAAVADFIKNVKEDNIFWSRYLEVCEKLIRKYGYCIFNRLTPVTATNFMNLFQPVFADPANRKHLLFEYTNDRESRLVQLAVALAERLQMQEQFGQFIIDDLEVIPELDCLAAKIIARRERNATPEMSVTDNPLTLLKDSFVREELQKLLPKEKK